MHYVFDACALLAFLRGEEGADKIETLLLDNNNRCSAHAVNLCEVYFNLVRKYGETTARAVLQNFKDIGVLPVDDMSEPFWQDAGNLKATIKRISLADCFGLVTARNFKSPFVTSDHHELEAVARHFPEIEIMFFR